ncbi:MAG TPA: tRNA pseudouridine(38-40) synthase TruA [Bryobacteraceae bacterium]|nr:tRNA pseudouridine(38-40) synthase TruA [Bryobacteraceae bacterium]
MRYWFSLRLLTYKLTLEYDGSTYSGWQTQTNARTVQGELQRAADELFGVATDVQGSGRTDAGVHALGQVAHVKVRNPRRKLAPGELLDVLNDRLPSSIAIVDAAEAASTFHARHDAIARSYFYQISTRKTALSKRYVWWIKQPLDIHKMSQAASLIAGRHDFAAFRAVDSAKRDESTIVVVNSAEIGRDEHLIVFRIEASHFLWKMIRRLTGALVKIGLGELTMDEFRGLLERGKNPKLDVAAWTAPASGLFLESVRY